MYVVFITEKTNNRGHLHRRHSAPYINTEAYQVKDKHISFLKTNGIENRPYVAASTISRTVSLRWSIYHILLQYCEYVRHSGRIKFFKALFPIGSASFAITIEMLS